MTNLLIENLYKINVELFNSIGTKTLWKKGEIAHYEHKFSCFQQLSAAGVNLAHSQMYK